MNEFELIQKVLRWAFYVLGIATIICWCLSEFQGLSAEYWLYCGLGAIFCSLIRFILRFIM